MEENNTSKLDWDINTCSTQLNYLSDWDIDTICKNSGRPDWDIDTSHANTPHSTLLRHSHALAGLHPSAIPAVPKPVPLATFFFFYFCFFRKKRKKLPVTAERRMPNHHARKCPMSPSGRTRRWKHRRQRPKKSWIFIRIFKGRWAREDASNEEAAPSDVAIQTFAKPQPA